MRENAKGKHPLDQPNASGGGGGGGDCGTWNGHGRGDGGKNPGCGGDAEACHGERNHDPAHGQTRRLNRRRRPKPLRHLKHSCFRAAFHGRVPAARQQPAGGNVEYGALKNHICCKP